jgi:hypothetical protein
VEQEYLKSSVFASFFTKSKPFLAHKSTANAKYFLYTMRFTSNAFIVSTVALLSLITTVAADSGDVAQITSPSGQTLNAFQSIDVSWYVVKRENPGAVCHHRSLTAGITAGPSSTARVWMALNAT